ncbi:TolC family protein [Chryseolinea soli]|uniref:TolC family protein n=1 Tax=Chryseolinea soli TaxID=2321403 RepID=A0A385SFI9_9BACT|nr:TolC family protein [Chryseolinea soli]AYB29146.1 TolC family protein [Chryseolinea soli]
MKIFWFAIGLLTATTANSQTLHELLKQAEANYPLLKAKSLEVQAGQNNIATVKSSALPSLDAAYQVNYATYNNITGMAMPQYFVPISGPPSSDNTSSGVFGSVGSLLLKWEPFTFGQRSSRIDLAKTGVQYNEADARNEIFKHQVTVINTYLDVLMAHELMKVYSKNLERSKENLRAVRTLTVSGLHPGVDTALFHGEVSRARIELLNHQKYLETQQATLSELLASDAPGYTPDSSYFHKLPSHSGDTLASGHPLLSLSESKLQIRRQQQTSIRRTLNPNLSVWATGYARGSGIRYDGVVNSSDGLSFSRYNYGAGLQLSVPLLRFLEVRPQLRQQSALISAEEERLSQVKLELNKQNKVADLTFRNALEVAKESPVFYRSAEFSFRALTTRYNSGLTNYADLIQAQYSLVKAETELKQSYLEAWKALLYKAAVQGDIAIFLNQVQ